MTTCRYIELAMEESRNRSSGMKQRGRCVRLREKGAGRLPGDSCHVTCCSSLGHASLVASHSSDGLKRPCQRDQPTCASSHTVGGYVIGDVSPSLPLVESRFSYSVIRRVLYLPSCKLAMPHSTACVIMVTRGVCSYVLHTIPQTALREAISPVGGRLRRLRQQPT